MYYSSTYAWIDHNFQYFIMAGIVCFGLLNILIVRYEKMKKIYRILTAIAGAVYVVVLFYVTLGTRTSGTDYRYELGIFWSYKATLDTGSSFYIYENIANIIAFLPLGMFMQEYIGKRFKWYGCTIFGMFISMGIEVSQLVFKLGLFEFDDIIHNTAGTFLGYMIALGIQCLSCKIIDKINGNHKNKYENRQENRQEKDDLL